MAFDPQSLSLVETEATIRRTGVGREESELTTALRPLVSAAAETRKTYVLPFKWGVDGALTKDGKNVVDTLQRLGRQYNVSIKVGSDSKDGERTKGSNVLWAAVDQITRTRKPKAETNGETA